MNALSENADRTIARATECDEGWTSSDEAERVARAIIADISGRGVWRRVINETDPIILEEDIIPAWAEIVRRLIAI